MVLFVTGGSLMAQQAKEVDLLRGLPGERPQADRNIAAVSLPDNDPLYGSNGPLKRIWKSR
jgi:uncharacterized protein YjlB